MSQWLCPLFSLQSMLKTYNKGCLSKEHKHMIENVQYIWVINPMLQFRSSSSLQCIIFCFITGQIFFLLSTRSLLFMKASTSALLLYWIKCNSHTVHDKPLYLPFTVSDTSFSPAPTLGTTARHTYFPASSCFTAFSVRVFLLLSTCVVRETVSKVRTSHFYLVEHQLHWHKMIAAFNKLFSIDKKITQFAEWKTWLQVKILDVLFTHLYEIFKCK